MSLFSFLFKHERFLEAELVRVREEHAVEIKTLREAHASELKYARDEIEQVRLYAASLGGIKRVPLTQHESDVEDGMEKLGKVVSENFLGTPWMRVQQRAQAQRDEEDRSKRERKQPGNGTPFVEEAPKEKTDGMAS